VFTVRYVPGIEIKLTLIQNSYLYDFMIELCRQQTEVAQNREIGSVCGIGKRKFQHRKYKERDGGVVKPTTVKCLNCRFMSSSVAGYFGPRGE
jgi:hypothetical protein